MRQTALIVIAILALTACREVSGPALEPVGNARTDEVRSQCERTGGRLGPASGGGVLACLRTLSDAGKSCSRASDCQGQCLARSGTCAPVSPLFGCHEVLLDDGRRVTECLE